MEILNGMNFYQILISFLIGSGLFGFHLFLRQISPNFRKKDDRISETEIQIISNQLSVFYNKIGKSKIRFASPIINEYGFIAVGNKEISRVYAAAPPCAPPANELISTLLPTIFDELSAENSDFSKSAIQNYI